LALVFALFAWNLWRNPDSWYLSGESMRPEFHAWPQLGLLMVALTSSVILAYLTFPI
jgi:hypothetical protein